jgi:hypothetical protein
VIEVNKIALPNASGPIVVTPVPIVSDVSAVFPKKDAKPIDVTLFAIVNDVTDCAHENA